MAKTNIKGYSKPTGKRKTKPKSRKSSKSNRGSLGKWIAALCIVVFLALVFVIFFGKKGHLGIDVSHHQGKINWEQVVKNGEVEFAYIKATEGVNYVDKQYKTNKDGARAQGIPIGPYHFFRADKKGKDQFAHFKKTVGRDFDLIPVLDLEELGGKIDDKKAYQKEVDTFIELFSLNYGYKPIVYGSYSFMKDYVYPSTKDCDYWLAWYVDFAKSVRDKRRFVNSLRPFIHPRIWQYTDKGSLPGISKDVDLDVCWEIQDIKVKK